MHRVFITMILLVSFGLLSACTEAASEEPDQGLARLKDKTVTEDKTMDTNPDPVDKGLPSLLGEQQTTPVPEQPAGPVGKVVTLESGLQYQTYTAGEGQTARSGDTVAVHYIGTLEDGTKFDSSVDRGQPFSFTIGEGRVIKGWEQGIPGMAIGEVRVLKIPAALGYGATGSPPAIPSGATLIFQVELLEIQ